MRKIVLIFLFTKIAFAYIDTDLDGVADNDDLCPNTLFTDLVNKNGCPIKTLSNTSSEHNFNFMIGFAKSELDQNTFEKTNTTYKTYQINYDYKKYSVYLATSTYKSNDEQGFNDTSLGLNYNFFQKNNLSISAGLEVIFPTYKSDFKNESTDYGMNIDIFYNFNNIFLFNRAAYTFINDKDIAFILHQNTISTNTGLGYLFNNDLYTSLTYYQSKSIYKDVDNIKSSSLNLNYKINNHYFISSSYSYGLSDSTSDNFISFGFGYNF